MRFDYVLKLLGASAVAASAMLALMVISVNVAPESREMWMVVVYPAVFAIVIGTLVMIVHINVTHVIAEDAKAIWRGRLWWGGPFVAGWYLWTVSSARGESTRRPNARDSRPPR